MILSVLKANPEQATGALHSPTNRCCPWLAALVRQTPLETQYGRDPSLIPASVGSTPVSRWVLKSFHTDVMLPHLVLLVKQLLKKILTTGFDHLSIYSFFFFYCMAWKNWQHPYITDCKAQDTYKDEYVGHKSPLRHNQRSSVLKQPCSINPHNLLPV